MLFIVIFYVRMSIYLLWHGVFSMFFYTVGVVLHHQYYAVKLIPVLPQSKIFSRSEVVVLVVLQKVKILRNLLMCKSSSANPPNYHALSARYANSNAVGIS